MRPVSETSATLPHDHSQRRRRAALLSAALAAALVAALLGAPASTSAAPTSAAPTSAAPTGEPVRLQPADGDSVATATVPLGSSGTARRGAAEEQPVVRRFETATSYSMVGFTWQGVGEPEIEVRSRGARGWSAWHRAAALHDGPTAGSAEGRGVRSAGATEALWLGGSDGIEVRIRGRADRLEMVLIDPGTPVPAVNERARAETKRKSQDKKTKKNKAKKATKPRSAPRPKVRPRAAWGPNKKWRNGKPRYSKVIKQVHVHHTASGNDYRKKDVPGLIRGMYAYHTRSLGWSDIGYNFLVDRFGRIWVGRAGGPGKRVQGAHTLGFNHKSTGIAVIGNFEEIEPAPIVLKKVARLAAWKLDKDGRKAAGKVRITSRGSDHHPSGTRVRLPAVDGHRDTNATACPGALLYARLPAIRSRAQARIDRY